MIADPDSFRSARAVRPRLLLAAFCAVCCLVLAATPSAYDLPVSGAVRVNLVEGSASWSSGAGQAGKAGVLARGMSLDAPASVEVSKGGRLEIALADGSVLRFSGGTRFSLVKADSDHSRRDVEVDVTLGDCWATVNKLMGGEFKVNSPTAVAGVAGTKYRLRVDAGNDSLYRVYEGQVRVTRRWTSKGEAGARTRVQGPDRVAGPKRISEDEWVQMISKGQQIGIGPDGNFIAPRSFDAEGDALDPFVLWNLQRDRELGI